MGRVLEINSDVRVKPKGRPRFYRGIAITDSATREFESTVRKMFAGLCKEPFDGPLNVQFVAYFARPKKTSFAYPPRGDVDNLFKSVSDAANKVIWHDDSQIVRMTSEKKWSDIDGFYIKISQVEL
jgi:Holliday junction resolvase RusA-like endonuclease